MNLVHVECYSLDPRLQACLYRGSK